MPYKGLTNESDPLLNTEPTSAGSGGGGGKGDDSPVLETRYHFF